MRSPAKTDELALASHLSLALSLDGMCARAACKVCARRVKTDELYLRVAAHSLLASPVRLHATFNAVELRFPFRKGPKRIPARLSVLHAPFCFSLGRFRFARIARPADFVNVTVMCYPFRKGP